ncbi:P-loop containing nucleoside triphosphate hydrolase protein [Venturia nashicola]|uniref:P-loop containing nucleoside triphosphate hydrolase protein n=1 Tax=Venturia nashicola TaxID=86259 RepID=A0A4Z1NXA6_9PEZI|nr:P-loop containing nucleoside triphosphate hydrolase protein [Venturia nashicola]
MFTDNWFLDRYLDNLGNMPPKLNFKRYFEDRTNGTPSTATTPVITPITIPVSQTESEPTALAMSSLESSPAWVNPTNPTEERETNAELCEKINKGLYHRRDKRDGAGETAATLKQYHNEAIRSYCKRSTETDPSSWVSCGEIPTTNEIMDITETWQKCDPQDNSIIMRGNKLVGSWESKYAYLGAHFEMLREDVTRPLREAVTWVKTFPDAGEGSDGGGNIGIYSKVHVSGITFSPRGMGIRIVFSLNKVGKNIRWEQSKRLLTGSIVALTPSSDMFRSQCIIAVVAARPLEGLRQNPPEIDLFVDPKLLEIDTNMEFLMVEERSSFFEADRHTMKALQKMMTESFPLSEHLINAETTVDAPEYVLQQPFRNMSGIFTSESDQFDNVDIISDWPKNAHTSLDKSQESALRRIMTKRVAIVQGPPGTGKTHVSVLSLKAMLDNMSRGDPPIIVACQTNHALDQLLRHVAEFEPSFARLGGRSKDTDVIKKRTLYNLRQGKQIRVPNGMRHTAKTALDNLTRAMSEALTPIEMKTGLLNHQLLFNHRLLTAAQCESLIKGDPKWSSADARRQADEPALKQWMGKQLVSNKKNFEQDTFGYEYEEADLEFEQLKELEAENCAQDDDDDFESLRGHHVSIWDGFIGRATSTVSDDEVRALLKAQDLYKIPSRFRGAVYNYLLRQVKDTVRAFIREKAIEYDQQVINFRAGGWEGDAVLLRRQGIKLIGMTTTGLSKYRALVSALSPRIVVIEEAAETMEAPVISACVPSLQHLILVGDHKQLRPQCAVKELQCPPFSLNVSLFERLVMNEVEYAMLKRQRRMIPEIRRILKPIYGKEIVDHPSMKDVTIRPPVLGLGGCNSFFYTHSWPESMDDQHSWKNDIEADMIVGFFSYLLNNGITEKQITVLTFYHGQRKLLLTKLRRHSQLGQSKIYKVVTVDSYQGEENDVVLLSMVRSNDVGKIGFLDVENRVCVALSRAKRGFFIFGNAELLCGESKLWSKVVCMMAGRKKELPATGPACRVVFRVPLVCENHGRKTWIEEPDIFQALDGGCQMKCGNKRICGHRCHLACHPSDCNDFYCQEKCSKVLPCGHGCTQSCDKPCVCAKCKDKHGGRVDSMSVSQSSVSSVHNWKGYADGGYTKHDSDMRDKMRKMNRLAEQTTSTRLDEFLVQQTEQIAGSTLRANNLPSYAHATRGFQANVITTTNSNSEPVSKYAAQKPHPQHPVAPQDSNAKPSRGKPRGGLENSIKRMLAHKASKKPDEPVDESDGLLIDFS